MSFFDQGPYITEDDLPDSKKLLSGIELIARERKRQIEEKGFTAEHDDIVNTSDELVRAAVRYVMPLQYREDTLVSDILRTIWPWNPSWWKPSPENRIRELEKSGALIAAEIDRLLRRKNVS